MIDIKLYSKSGIHIYLLTQELCDSGEDPAYISDRLGCSISALTKRCNRYKIYKIRANGIYGKYHDFAIDLYRKGFGDREIAKALNVGRSTIRTWRHNNCLKPNIRMKHA